jgi:hypothetical protein
MLRNRHPTETHGDFNQKIATQAEADRSDGYHVTTTGTEAASSQGYAPCTALETQRDNNYHRAIAFLNGFKLICSHDPDVESNFFRSQSADLLSQVEAMEHMPARQYQQLIQQFSNFYTHLVTLLETQNIENAETTLRIATDCVSWQHNKQACYSEPSYTLLSPNQIRSVQIDRHLAPPGLDYEPSDNYPATQTMRYYREQTSPPWLQDCAKWLQVFLRQQVFSNVGRLKTPFTHGMPPSLTTLPGFRHYAQHTFHMQQTTNTLPARHCLRVSNLIPTDMPAHNDLKVELAVKSLHDIIESQLDTMIEQVPSAHRNSQNELYPLPFLIQTPGTGNADHDSLLYQALIRVCAVYADPANETVDSLRHKGFKLHILNSQWLFEQRQNLAPIRHWRQTDVYSSHRYFRIIKAYFQSLFSPTVFTECEELAALEPSHIDIFIWQPSYTQVLLQLLQDNIVYRERCAEQEGLFESLTMLLRTYEQLSQLHQLCATTNDASNNLHLMSTESVLCSQLGGVTAVHESEQDLGSMLIMHTDSLYEHLNKSPYRYAISGRSPFPPPQPSNGAGDLEQYSAFNTLFAEKIESEHHDRFAAGARLGLSGNRALKTALPAQMQILLAHREQLRYLQAYFSHSLSTEGRQFNPQFMPNNSQLLNSFFAKLEQAIATVTTSTPKTDKQNYSSNIKRLRRRLQLSKHALAGNSFNLSQEHSNELMEIIEQTLEGSKVDYQQLLVRLGLLKQRCRPLNENQASDHVSSFHELLLHERGLQKPDMNRLNQAVQTWIRPLYSLGYAPRTIDRVNRALLPYQQPGRYSYLRRVHESQRLAQPTGLFRLEAAESWWQVIFRGFFYCMRMLKQAIQRISTLAKVTPAQAHDSVTSEVSETIEDTYRATEELLKNFASNFRYSKLFRSETDESQELLHYARLGGNN